MVTLLIEEEDVGPQSRGHSKVYPPKPRLMSNPQPGGNDLPGSALGLSADFPEYVNAS